MATPARDSTQLDESVYQEKAVLIGMQTPRQVWDNLEELSRLSKTAGAHVMHKITQKRPRPDLKTYLGKGKVEELIQIIKRSMIPGDFFSRTSPC